MNANAARTSLVAMLASALVASSPCAQTPVAQGDVTGPDCSSFPCGRVVSIRQSTVKQQWTPLGTAPGAGGVTGANGPGDNPATVAALQIGSKNADKGLVLLGSAGGASYKKFPDSYQQSRWDVTVKLDNGMTRVVTLAYEPYVKEGDRVRVAGNNVELAD